MKKGGEIPPFIVLVKRFDGGVDVVDRLLESCGGALIRGHKTSARCGHGGEDAGDGVVALFGGSADPVNVSPLVEAGVLDDVEHFLVLLDRLTLTLDRRLIVFVQDGIIRVLARFVCEVLQYHSRALIRAFNAVYTLFKVRDKERSGTAVDARRVVLLVVVVLRKRYDAVARIHVTELACELGRAGEEEGMSLREISARVSPLVAGNVGAGGDVFHIEDVLLVVKNAADLGYKIEDALGTDGELIVLASSVHPFFHSGTFVPQRTFQNSETFYKITPPELYKKRILDARRAVG